MEMTKEERTIEYIFGQDDDGHWYLIPLDLSEKFVEWLEWQEKLWSSSTTEEEYREIENVYDGPDFDDHRIDSYTDIAFSNPREV